jgi:FtsP/CotA-like multicopper oxidase with cupredoxin domain
MKNMRRWKNMTLIGLVLLGVALTPGLASAYDVYLVAQPFTYQNTNAANPHYSPVLSGITMWGFAPANSSFVTTGPASVPGPRINVPANQTVLKIHLKNTLAEPVSVVIPGLGMPVDGGGALLAPVYFPADPVKGTRVRSITAETAANGGTMIYTWNNLKPGSYIYQSGSHMSVQVQMGLYGPVTPQLAGATPYPAHNGEQMIFYSEIDTALHAAVAGGTFGPGLAMTSTSNYHPKYFLVNGVPYSAANPPASLGLGALGNTVLLRFFNAGMAEHVPTLLGRPTGNTTLAVDGFMDLIAEDGNLYPFPKKQYSVLLPAGKTIDALFKAQGTAGGKYPLFDRSLSLTNNGVSPGGNLVYLQTGVAPLAKTK